MQKTLMDVSNTRPQIFFPKLRVNVKIILLKENVPREREVTKKNNVISAL